MKFKIGLIHAILDEMISKSKAQPLILTPRNDYSNSLPIMLSPTYMLLCR